MDANVVRTVFKTEWLGSSVLSGMIAKYRVADKVMSSLGSGAATGGTAAFSAGAQYTRAMARMQAGLVKELDAGAISAGQAERALAGYSIAQKDMLGITEEATAATGVFGTGISGLVVGLAAAAAAVIGVVVAFKTLMPMLEEGATVAQLDQSFRYLNLTMTDSPNLLRDMKDAANGTLTTMAAQEGIMTLVAGSSKEMTQALTDAAPRILEISKAANKLNPALGDTNFMFTSLAKGLKRAEPRLIDNLGLKLRVSDANRAYAAELGKTVAQLTAEDKQMAILNETLRAGALLIEQVGGSVEGLGDPFLRAQAASEDLKATWKEMLFYALGIGGALDTWSVYVQEDIVDVGRYKSMMREALNRELITQREFDKLVGGAGTPSLKTMEAGNKLIADRTKLLAEQRAVMTQQNIWRERGTNWRDEWEYTIRDPNPELSKEEVKGIWETGDEKLVAARQRYRDSMKEISADQLSDAQGFRDKDAASIQAWLDGVIAASEQAIEAWRQYHAELGAMGIAHREADTEASYYKTTIDAIGDTYTNIGGPTKEQTELLENLTDELEDAEQGYKDFGTGMAGFGLDEEKLGKAVEKAGKEVAWYTEKLKQVKVAEDEWVAGHTEAEWSQEKLTDAMTKAAEAAGVSIEDYLRYQMSIGELSEEQAAAVLAAVAMETEMGRIWGRVDAKEVKPSEAREELRKFQLWLDQQDLTVFLRPELLPPKYSGKRYWEDSPTIGQPEENWVDELPYNDQPEEANLTIAAIPTIEDEEADLWELLMGEEPMPDLISGGINMSKADAALSLWIAENGTIVFQGTIEFGDDGTSSSGMSQEELDKRFGTGAGGGNIMANQRFLVGEEGPEMITMGSNSTITPNNQLGGSNITMNLEVHSDGNTDDLASVVEDVLLEALQQVGVI